MTETRWPAKPKIMITKKKEEEGEEEGEWEEKAKEEEERKLFKRGIKEDARTSSELLLHKLTLQKQSLNHYNNQPGRYYQHIRKWNQKG